MQPAKVTSSESYKKQQPQSIYSYQDPQFKDLFSKKSGNDLMHRNAERRQQDPADTINKYSSNLGDAKSL